MDLYRERKVMQLVKRHQNDTNQQRMKEPKILLWRQDGTQGQAVNKRDYDTVAAGIIHAVLNHQNKEIDLRELIDQIRCTLSLGLGGDTLWFILQVKQDLEQRGIVRSIINRDHVQVIRLTKSRSTLVRAYTYSLKHD
jgi:hypothetical protein